jgi:hypothetical protein
MKEHFDGETLLPTLEGTGQLQRKYLLYEGWVWRYAGVRTADGMTYLHFNHSGAEELYDLNGDPYQVDSLLVGETTQNLSEITEELSTCQADACRAASQ